MANFLKGALTGLILGGALGILFAPKSGKETRQDLQEKMEEIGGKISNQVSKVKNRSRSVIDDIMEEYEELELSENQKSDIRIELESCFEKVKEIAEE